jgi:uncharacterized protein (DUF2336 family)
MASGARAKSFLYRWRAWCGILIIWPPHFMTTTGSLLEDLENALAAGSEAQREGMLARITDLFVGGAGHYSPDQVVLFDEILGKLAAAIETQARAKLAERLARMPNAPPGLIHRLAFDDDIRVAAPVLGWSEQLAEADLVANASTKSQNHLGAISERRALTENVTDVLVTRGDQQVVRKVTKNPGARFSFTGFRTLVRRSAGDDALALQLGARPDIPRQHFLRLLDQASATVRRQLTAENPAARSAIEGVVHEVGGEIRSEARNTSYNYALAQADVAALRRAGRLNEGAVQAFARERRFEHTVVAVSLLAQVDNDMVERALLAPAHDFLLILMKLAGFSWQTAKLMLMLKVGGGGMAQQDLDKAMASFGRLQAGTARRVLSFYQSRPDVGAEAQAGA